MARFGLHGGYGMDFMGVYKSPTDLTDETEKVISAAATPLSYWWNYYDLPAQRSGASPWREESLLAMSSRRQSVSLFMWRVYSLLNRSSIYLYPLRGVDQITLELAPRCAQTTKSRCWEIGKWTSLRCCWSRE